MLKELVCSLGAGPGAWTAIASRMATRSSRQCHERCAMCSSLYDQYWSYAGLLPNAEAARQKASKVSLHRASRSATLMPRGGALWLPWLSHM